MLRTNKRLFIVKKIFGLPVETYYINGEYDLYTCGQKDIAFTASHSLHLWLISITLMISIMFKVVIIFSGDKDSPPPPAVFLIDLFYPLRIISSVLPSVLCHCILDLPAILENTIVNSYSRPY